MEIFVKNISKIREATIELNGITVIAGENNTGKSTIGKILYSVFLSMNNIKTKVSEYRVKSVFQQIFFTLQRSLIDVDLFSIINKNEKYTLEIAKKLVENIDEYKGNISKIEDFMEKEIEEQLEVKELSSRIDEILNVSDSDVFKQILGLKLNLEFHKQINNFLYKDELGEIILKEIGQNDITINVKENKVIELKNAIDLVDTNAVYIDDPFVLDNLGERFSMYDGGRKSDLIKSLENIYEGENPVKGVINREKFEDVMKKVNSVCSGTVISSSGEFFYRSNELDENINIKNVSTGLKTFIILKTLLLNGTINENCVVVLDEPEIHLHPKWQLLFAEIIVLLQKQFGMKILVNTHSPYFLEAIDVYTRKHEVDENCKYYLTRVEKEVSYIDDVTGNIREIYKKMAEPFKKLDLEKLQL